jgi:hypothetical protein
MNDKDEREEEKGEQIEQTNERSSNFPSHKVCSS